MMTFKEVKVALVIGEAFYVATSVIWMCQAIGNGGKSLPVLFAACAAIGINRLLRYVKLTEISDA